MRTLGIGRVARGADFASAKGGVRGNRESPENRTCRCDFAQPAASSARRNPGFAPRGRGFDSHCFVKLKRDATLRVASLFNLVEAAATKLDAKIINENGPTKGVTLK